MGKLLTHEEFVERLKKKHPNIQVLSEYVNSKVPIKVKCLNDGFEFSRRPDQLLRLKNGCPVCSGRKVLPGRNDLNTLRPDLTKYLLNPKDGDNVRPKSNKRIKVKCPHCGHVKEIVVFELYTYGFSCPICSDGISYPNKFIRNMLTQLNVEFRPEHIFEWSPTKRYDQYIPNYNLIIENHGRQHFEQVNYMMSLEEQKENDKEKREKAILNGIENYVELDCAFSNLEYIKKSVLESSLPQILNFSESDVNWTECEIAANKSNFLEAIKLFDSGIPQEDGAKLLNIGFHTFRDYILKADKLGLLKTDKDKYRKFGQSIYITEKDKILKEIMDYKSNNPESDYVEIAKALHRSKRRVKIFLQDAYENGEIDYDFIAERKRNVYNNNPSVKNRRKVYAYDLDYNLIGVYDSCIDVERKTNGKYDHKTVSGVCLGYQKTYRNTYFSYEEIKKENKE